MRAHKVKQEFVSSSQGTALFVGLILWLIISVLFYQLSVQQKKRLKEAQLLERVKSLKRSILDAASYSIISTTPQGVITTFNEAAEHLLGYKASEVVGKVTPAIIHKESEVVAYTEKLNQVYGTKLKPGFETFIYRARLEGKDTQEWSYVRKEGSTFPVRLTTTVIKGEEGDVIGYLGIAEDLTKEKDLLSTVENQRALMLSTAKMSALGEMAAGISHEINNPLAIISGVSSILEFELESNGKIDSEFALPQLKKIQKTIDRIAKIVQGLRSFSRESTSDHAEVQDLSVVINETLTFCQERFRIHGINLELKVEDGLMVKVHLTQLSQVILNLLNNSYDGISELPEKWIKLEAKKDKGRVIMTITDSGPGITREIAERMMEPFYTTKEVGKGTGLGLSISLGIVRSYGGSLDYNAAHPHTQFILDLPLVEA